MKIELTQDQLNATIKVLEFAQGRYEQEAAALIGAAQHEQDETLVRLSRELGREHLEQADQASNLVEFYLSL